MKEKQHLSASVDGHFLQAARSAVEQGRASSVSAWVSDALCLKADYDPAADAVPGGRLLHRCSSLGCAAASVRTRVVQEWYSRG